MPSLHANEIKILQSVAARGLHGERLDAGQISRQIDTPEAVVARLLTGMGSAGLVHLERSGPGQPFSVRITRQGLKALSSGQDKPKADSMEKPAAQKNRATPKNARPKTKPKGKPAEAQNKPAAGAKQAAISPLSGSESEPKGSKSRGGKTMPGKKSQSDQTEPRPFSSSLYDALSVHMGGMDRESIAGMVDKFSPQLIQVLTQTLGGDSAAKPVSARGGHQKSDPPELSQVEQALEKKLAEEAHQDYSQLPWHQRTKLFSFEWDQMRRRRIGVLTTYFNSFGPRWERADWKDFNLARRQADSRGAQYVDWISAQFDRIGLPENGYVAPASFHGRKAVEAYLQFKRGESFESDSTKAKTAAKSKPRNSLQPKLQAPSDMAAFDLHNPEHRAWAEEKMSEVEQLSQTVFGNDEQGLLRLVCQAIKTGNLPQQALDLRIPIKAKILKIIQDESKAKGGPIALGGKPRLII